MNYCKKHFLAPAQKMAWDKAEIAYILTFKLKKELK